MKVLTISRPWASLIYYKEKFIETRSSIPPVGTKVIITVVGYFGHPVSIEGKIFTAPYHHGYTVLKSGAWSLYDLSKRGFECAPAYKFEFLPKKKKKTIAIKCADVIKLEKEK